ncbi:ABC transporter permease [Butyrivibrio sp. MC2013]|uniref:ABC transporter permease n=1 Tax=Butyrivibrio sp. MC2013 TaxID=1280686 RepID=UPI00041C1342|nr:ABC transporter permease subunit [Butyrivibrio sp. MC2013]
MAKLWKYRYLYLLILPGILYFVIFRYIPMYGVVIAFQDFSINKGIWGSKWVGLEQFRRLFLGLSFPAVFRNTVIISLCKLVMGFPAPIILALLLNEVKSRKFKKITQTIVYLPHFISWVILAGLISMFLHPDTGLINEIVKFFNDGKGIDFLVSKEYFRSILVITDIYKGIGWGSIVYIAAISSIDSTIYEAAMVDGAGRLAQIWHITLPALKSTIVVMFILNMGGILNAGFEQILLLYNPRVYDVADIIDTYVYRNGIMSSNYSMSTAAGLFKSVISMALIIFTNKMAHLLEEDGLW